MPGVFRILMVCTGNICRSPQAEQVLRARIAQRHPELESAVVVESAGTQALVGSPMPREAAALSIHHGGDPEGHSARQLTPEHVRSADLVLAMAAEHRSAAVRLLPRASQNAFTLTEFAALLESAEQNQPAAPGDFAALDKAEKLRSAVKWASRRRGYLPPEDAAPGDVVDPYRRSEGVYAESARQIVGALDRTQRAAVNLAQRVGA